MRFTRLALFGSCMAAVGLCLGGCNDQPTVSAQPQPAAAPATSAETSPTQARLAHMPDRPDPSPASPEEVQRRCGPAASVTRKNTSYTTESADLWYPRSQVEVLLTEMPAHGRTLWVFYGGYKSADPEDERHYTHAQLAKRMPCLKEWTDAAAQADRDLGVPEP